MDENEQCLFIGFIMAGAWVWIRWYWTMMRIPDFVSPSKYRMPLLLTPLACVVLLFVILRTLASFDVVNSSTYLTFYMLYGIMWVGLALYIFPYLGISARDDAVERRNPAATYALTGALIAVTLCFAGGNVGDGPGWWVVTFVASLATTSLFVIWMLLEVTTRIGETVTIDRDPAAGIRLSGFLIGTGLILGRGAAGNYLSMEQQLVDFIVHSAPVLLLLVFAILIERALRPRVERPMSPAVMGILPALLYIGAAGLVLWQLGAV